MKVVLLAGGRGTRLAEETSQRPKPMVMIGDRPILWHVMSVYAQHGYKEFVVALGYLGDVVKDYFLRAHVYNSDVTVSLADGSIELAGSKSPDWKVSLVDTGGDTLTGGRLRRLAGWLGNQTFCMSYGDGLANVDVTELVEFHKRHGRLATVTAVNPASRMGRVELDGDRVVEFSEKPSLGPSTEHPAERGRTHRINGGFFVLEPGVFDYIDGDATMWEFEPLRNLAADGQLMAFRHDGFWYAMDTIRDRQVLCDLWESGERPWLRK